MKNKKNTEWTKVNFGKYRGNTLPQIIFKDADWFYWAFENSSFKNDKKLVSEAIDIYEKSCRIRIPKKMIAEYVIDDRTGKFSRIILVKRAEILEDEFRIGYVDIREKVINLSYPRSIAEYDKKGSRQIVKDMKKYILGNASYRMTKERSEDFFNKKKNFKLKYKLGSFYRWNCEQQEYYNFEDYNIEGYDYDLSIQ